MITRMRIENYRSHRDSEFTLEPLTVFVGPCASGKSNIFSALGLLQGTAVRELYECFDSGMYDFHRVRSLWLKGSDSIAFAINVSSLPDLPGWEAAYRLAVTKGADVYQVTEERLDAEEPEESGGRRITCFHRKWSAEEHPSFGHVDPWDATLLCRSGRSTGIAPTDERMRVAQALQWSLSRLGSYRPDAGAIHAMNTVEQSLWPGYRGENLAACLNYVRLQRKDVFEAIVAKLRSFLPNLEGIIIHSIPPNRCTFSLSFRDFVEPVPAPLLSDGTTLSLAYLVISQLASPPLVLCLEEPENGYHPRRLRELMDMFVRLAYPADDAEPVQVLVSTHSPYLLDYFNGELEKCIRIVEMQDGRSVVTDWLSRKAERTPEQIEGDEEVPVGQLWAQGLYGGV